MCLFTVSPLSHRLSWFVDVHEFDSLKVVIIIHAIAMMSVLSHDCSDECTWDSVPSICDVTLDQLVCPESLSNWRFRCSLTQGHGSCSPHKMKLNARLFIDTGFEQARCKVVLTDNPKLNLIGSLGVALFLELRHSNAGLGGSNIPNF